MNKKIIFIVFIIVFTIVSIALYIFYPRNVKFIYILEFDAHEYLKPSDRIDYCFNYRSMILALQYRINDPNNKGKKIMGYSDSFLEEIANQLDFDNFDYIISTMRPLNKLLYSPYLTVANDTVYHIDSRYPLIPKFDQKVTNKVYFYAIKKNNKFRNLGP